MNNEEVKRTVMIYLAEYHNDLLNEELTQEQLNEIFNRISKRILNYISK